MKKRLCRIPCPLFARQDEHHRKMPFQDEVRALLRNIRSNGMTDTFGIETQPRWGWALGRRSFPRVARASQPWALRRNPVGIPGHVSGAVSAMASPRSKNIQIPSRGLQSTDKKAKTVRVA